MAILNLAMKNCIFKSLLICIVLFQCLSAFAVANKVGDVVTNVINLDERKKVSLPEAVWDINVIDSYKVDGRNWKYFTLKNRDPESITPYILINYSEATLANIFSNPLKNDCSNEADSFSYVKNSYAQKKESIERCSSLKNYSPSSSWGGKSYNNFYISKKDISSLFYISSLKEDFINSFSRVQNGNGDAIEINIPILTGKIGVLPSDHYGNMMEFNKGKVIGNYPVFNNLIDDWLYKLNQATGESFINGYQVKVSSFADFSPLISFSIKSGEPIEIAAKTASNLLSNIDKVKIAQEEIYKNSLQTSLSLTLAQAEPEKFKFQETNDPVEQKIVDLSFDLGDGRKIQLPNGKWRVFEEYKFRTTQDYKAIIFKNELVEKSPVYFSIYFSNKKEIKWNEGCGQLEKSKKLYFSGMQSNGIDKNTISCGSYNYYDGADAASIDHVITRDDYLAKVLKTISEDQSIIIQSFIIERGGDNKMVMAMIEPINSKNIQTKNSGEYIKISKWNELFLKRAEESFYENKKVASLDLVSRSISGQNTQVASTPTNSNQAVSNDDKLKEQQRMALEAQQKEQVRLKREAWVAQQWSLARDDQARMAQESNQKDQERQLAEQNAKDQLRVAEESKLKEQQRLALETQQKDQARLAQEAKQKEQERLLADQKVKEQLRLAEETAKAKDLELAKLKQELASMKLQKENASPAPSARKALVIGNDNYSSVTKLSNARQDANAVGRTLTDLGYKVMVKNDLTEKDMKATLRQFKNDLEGGDEVVIFYAGHGIQIGSTNYLLPTDIKGESEDQVRDDAIQLQRLLDDMNEKKVKLTLAMIDACRDNPFPKAGRAIGTRGLAPTTAATGQMIIFSAGSGQQALDKLGPTDKNPNGLFTRMLLSEMKAPGVRVDNMIREVRRKVVDAAKSVGHEQVPAIYDQVVGDFYFNK